MVPVNSFLLEGNERKYLNECIDTGWISSDGPFVERFEREFSKYIGRAFGIAVSSGSAALDIAVKALGIGPGDEVIMPTFTIISPAFSIIRAGGIPVLVDSDPLTWNMDIRQIEAKITSRTRAILAVDTYGLPVDIEPVLALAKKYKLKTIVDSAEMHGQTVNGLKCGSVGDISIFSFYANKHITSGEGGMVLCNDPALAQKCRKLRNLSFEPDKPRFVHYEMGWNYRITNMQAALGLAQLEQLDKFILIKKAMGRYYQQELQFLRSEGFNLPLESVSYAENIYWVFGLVAPTISEKERILAQLSKKKIGHRPFFWCMHEQPVFAAMNLFLNESYPVAENLARNGFYIPSGLGLSEADRQTVVKSIKELYG